MIMARINNPRYSKKVKNRDNRCSQASFIIKEEGSTTIEHIAYEKYISEEVSRVGYIYPKEEAFNIWL